MRMVLMMLVLAVVIVGTVVVLMRVFAIFVATSDTHTAKQMELREREMQLYLTRAQVLDTRISVVEGQPKSLQRVRKNNDVATRSE
jgi:cell division protein FtsI/penicillin-binding protein 2